jgi:hypothetical protein
MQVSSGGDRELIPVRDKRKKQVMQRSIRDIG